MAESGSWPSIQKHGLLSTTALLDLFEIQGLQRFQIECCHRPESVEITHKTHGSAVIRDQKPMSDQSVRKALLNGLSPADWYRELNSKVFFWLTERRLEILLNARAYRSKRHDVLIVDTRRLVERHQQRIVLSPMNSGCTIPFPHKRGLETFRRMADYPYQARSRNRDPIVELAVDYKVPDIRDLVLQVKQTGGGVASKVIWTL